MFLHWIKDQRQPAPPRDSSRLCFDLVGNGLLVARLKAKPDGLIAWLSLCDTLQLIFNRTIDSIWESLANSTDQRLIFSWESFVIPEVSCWNKTFSQEKLQHRWQDTCCTRLPERNYFCNSSPGRCYGVFSGKFLHLLLAPCGVFSWHLLFLLLSKDTDITPDANALEK